MFWYSKKRVLDKDPKVFSNWLVICMTMMESMPYFSMGARVSMRCTGSLIAEESSLFK